MAKSFYAIMVRWNYNPSDAKVEEIDAALGQIGDWLRFSGHNWIIWTDNNEHRIFQVLAGKLAQTDSELIFKIDPFALSGWAPSWVEAWIVERRSGDLNLLLPPPPKPSR